MSATNRKVTTVIDTDTNMSVINLYVNGLNASSERQFQNEKKKNQLYVNHKEPTLSIKTQLKVGGKSQKYVAI